MRVFLVSPCGHRGSSTTAVATRDPKESNRQSNAPERRTVFPASLGSRDMALVMVWCGHEELEGAGATERTR